MTAFEVYLVMQADSIRLLLGCAAFGFVALCILSLEVRDGKAYLRVPRFVLLMAVALFSGVMLVPSTKTLAAMYVIPAVTSEHAVEKIAPEVREVWELAKDALREAGKKSEVEK
jgi:hypothetical protein